MHHAEELENTTSVDSAGAAVSGEHEIEIDADDDVSANSAGRRPAMSSSVVNTVVTRAVNRSADEETFELSDDEIQPAEAVERPSLLPSGTRRPPPPPSMRPRPQGASSLPPAARPSGTLWSSTQSATSARARIVELEQEAADARWQLANRTLELTRVKARCSELESVLAHRAQELVALERRLAEALGQNGTLPSNGRSRTAAVDLSEKATLERTPTPATVSVVTPIDPGRARELPSAPATVPSATVSSVIKSQAAQAQPIRATETQPSSAEAVDESPFPGDVEETPTPSPADVDAVWAEGTEELGLISGINPGIAQTLRAQGVTRLSQIAAWSDDDIRRIAKAIRVPKSRISRGRWVQKAREAMKMASVATSTGSLPREEEAPTSSSGA